MPELYLRPVGGYWLILLSGLLFLSLVSLQSIRARLAGRQFWFLAALRVLTVLVALFAMLRPTLIYTDIRKQPATLVILADSSRSMSVKDLVGNRSRWQGVQQQLEEVAPTLAELREDLEIKILTFDAETAQAKFDGNLVTLPAAAEGNQTAIGAALAKVLRDSVGERLAGVVLLSDGAQRALPDRNEPPDIYAAQMQAEGIPIYAVAFGEGGIEGQIADVSLNDLQVNPTVFVKNALVVGGTVRINGYANKPVDVELLFEDPSGEMVKVPDTKEVTATKNGQQFTVQLTHVPEVPGEYKLTMRAKPLDGERLTTNNERSTFVTVLKGGVTVLYLEGSPRTEQKYLRWSLGASKNIEVHAYQLDPAAEDAFSVLPPDVFQPGKFDVILIGDLDSKAFGSGDEFFQRTDKLNELVSKNGAGLMMFGGFQSFGPGGWQRLGPQPKDERRIRPNETKDYLGLLPVAMRRTARQDLDANVQRDLHLVGEQKMLPTAEGERHFVMILDSGEKNRTAWEELPPLEGANRFREVTPLAQVLAKTENGDPLLVAHEVGAGRAMAFAGDSTWRWWMLGQQEAHQRFWRQVVLWLAKKDETSESGVWIRLNDRRFEPGQRVEVTTGAETPEGERIDDATFEATVTLPDGTSNPIYPKRAVEGVFRDVFLQTQQSGDYTVEITAKDSEGKLIGTAKARFLVFERDLELDNPAANPGLLARLAKMTRGELLAPEQLPGLLKELQQQGLNAELPIQTKLSLWDNWVVFLLFIGLLITDWYLRKRWSLV